MRNKEIFYLEQPYITTNECPHANWLAGEPFCYQKDEEHFCKGDLTKRPTWCPLKKAHEIEKEREKVAREKTVINDDGFVEGESYPKSEVPDGKVDWIPVGDVITTLTQDWRWIKNMSCKYVDLRIDTRDMHCVIFDRDHKFITLDQLHYQYKSK